MEPEIVNLDMPLHLLKAHTHLKQTHRTNTAELLEKNSPATGQLTLKYEQGHAARGQIRTSLSGNSIVLKCYGRGIRNLCVNMFSGPCAVSH